MSSSSANRITELRQILAERFPTAPRTSGRVLATGVPAIDAAVGGLPLSAITEIVCSAPSCGGHLLLARLLACTRAASLRAALIDATDSFDPASFEPDLLAHLLWVRCAKPSLALPAADLLTRDANLGLVMLDLRRAPVQLLRRTPSTFWYRLQRAVEPTDLALVIETPHSVIPSAQLRLALDTSPSLLALDRERPSLATSLTLSLQRQRLLASTG